MLRREIKKYYPSCPYCGSRNVRRNGSRRGKQRFICRDCGRTFYSNSRLNTLLGIIEIRFREVVWKHFFEIADEIIRMFAKHRNLSNKVAVCLSWGIRKVASSISYRKLEAILRSPVPFRRSEIAIDDNAIWRRVLRLDLATLAEFIDYTSSIAEKVASLLAMRLHDCHLDPILGVDSTLVLMVSSTYLQNYATLKFHIHGNLALGIIKDVSFSWGTSDLPAPVVEGFAFVLGDTEYYSTGYVGRVLRAGLVPVVRVKEDGVKGSNDVLFVYRWLYRRYVRFLYRWRGVVEGLIASSAPHSNVLFAKSARGDVVEVLLRCAIRNIFVLGLLLFYYADAFLGVSPNELLSCGIDTVCTSGICFVSRYHTESYRVPISASIGR